MARANKEGVRFDVSNVALTSEQGHVASIVAFFTSCGEKPAGLATNLWNTT
jgi:hypothetical protein